MQGLGGNDWYYVDHPGDRAIEAVGGGSDRVLTSVSYTLEAGSEIELFTTTNTASTSAINLTGNAFANSMIGNAGANIINGGGNADLMQGLGGNDWYYVDHAGDRAIEAVGGGSDRVLTSVSYTLEAGSEIELFTTNNTASTSAINLTGNGFANSMIGNAGANIINGGGNADLMQGLGGNDTYIVDNPADRAFETGGNGFDTVRAIVDFALEAGSEIEVLATTNNAGLAAINLTGNALGQTVNGDAGANILNGLGGNDTLTGFGGSDNFRFTAALNASTNVDQIIDFNVADDTIQLDDAVFLGLSAGRLNPNAFRISAAAADADDRIIYNDATGALTFDSNGNVAGGATQFATLSTGLLLTNADFFVTRTARPRRPPGTPPMSTTISPQDQARILSEALPHMQRYDEETIVVKYGGHAMGDEEVARAFARDIVLLEQTAINPVVVHGGGPQIEAMLKKAGVQSQFAGGLRVTDKATLEIVEMVLAGSINKQIVGYINAAGGKAIGLCGKDGNMVLARKATRKVVDPDSRIERVVDLGFVGEPEKVDTTVLNTVLGRELIPVLAPVCAGADGSSFNVNADTFAGAIAGALKAKRFLLLTDVPGVLDKNKKLIEKLSAAEVRGLIADGTISGGMIPKVETCLYALEQGVEGVVILDGKVPHAVLLELFTDHGAGTLIYR